MGDGTARGPASRPSVSIVIPSYNPGSLLARCLDSCAAQTFKDFETIVVDNGSSDDCSRVALGYAATLPLRVIRLDVNAGFTGGVNAGIRAASGEWVLMLNVDVELDEDFLSNALRSGAVADEDGAVGPLVFDSDRDGRLSSVQTCGTRVGWDFRTKNYTLSEVSNLQRIFGPASPAALLRGAALDDVRFSNGEYLDSRLGTYFEDVDLWIRLRLRGWKTVVVLESKCWHRGGVTAEGKRIWQKRLELQRMAMRNRLLVFASVLPWGSMLLLMPGFILSELGGLLLFGFRNAVFVKATTLAKWDALRMLRHISWRRREILGGARLSTWDTMRSLFFS